MSDITTIEVDVIIPVHNASSTVKEAVLSALHQEIPSSPRYSPSPLLQEFLQKYSILVTVCCYDDGSKDESLDILRQIESSRSGQNGAAKKEVVGSRSIPTTKPMEGLIPSRLIVESSEDGEARGAGYARNRAIEMNNKAVYDRESPEKGEAESNERSDHVKDSGSLKFLCLLDSDDVMHKHRIIEQVLYMMFMVDDKTRNRTILGSTFNRDPPDSTWHYSNWANNLTDKRLMLERYREITILQPTWFMPLAIWSRAGGYIEAPSHDSSDTVSDVLCRSKSSGSSSLEKSCLIHPKFDTLSSLRLVEDLRFFHSHLESNGTLRVHRTALATIMEGALPLVTYRHVENAQSQSFRTSRKLLLQLRALAFQKSVIRVDPFWNTDEENRFVIWGCGRDGKDFFKALDQDLQERVYCFVDVDAKKLNAGYYVDTTSQRAITQEKKSTNGNSKSEKKQKCTARKIPIVHFSFLIPDQQEQEVVRSEWISSCTTGNNSTLGCIDKSKSGSAPHSVKNPSQPKKKKRKFGPPITPTAKLQDRGLDRKLLSQLPVVVCVAMYRTNGVLESNVGKIGRTEGKDLWHFS